MTERPYAVNASRRPATTCVESAGFVCSPKTSKGIYFAGCLRRPGERVRYQPNRFLKNCLLMRLSNVIRLFDIPNARRNDDE
jgi:hypothetical protein